MWYLPINQQGTIIQFPRLGEHCYIWTSDTEIIKKLDTLLEVPDSPWKCINHDYVPFNDNEFILWKEYKGLKANIMLGCNFKE